MSKGILDKLEVLQGNIVNLKDKDGKNIIVDAVVNSAKPTLMCGAGVSHAIYNYVNSYNANISNFLENEIIKETDKGIVNANRNRIRCSTNEIFVTEGYGLCNYIFHAVAPNWDGGSKSCIKSLQKCYENIIDSMIEKNCETIAIPIISSGHNKFPFDLAAKIAIVSILNYLIKLQNCDKLKKYI